MQSAYHLDSIGAGTESRPALRTAAIEDLLIQLLVGHEKHEIDALLWLREKLGNARRHEEAMQRAMQIALSEFTSRLDPNELSIGADQEQQQQVNGASSLDNALSNRFRSITERTSGGLPHLFAESFARVYSEEFRRADKKL
jgi:predicted component of type VI protein secretion system